MALPLKDATITNIYGVRKSGYAKPYHTGVDLVSNNTTIYASVAGQVIEVGWDADGWGNYVIYRMDGGKYDLIHAHMSQVNVHEGENVMPTAVLGIVGDTGNSTASHLHFEVRKAPWENCDDINPCVFLGINNNLGKVYSC